MKRLYSPSEIAVLERYIDVAFPIKRRIELLPGRSKPSIQKRLNAMRRRAGVLYRVRRT